MASILWKRDITSQVDGVKHTLSSWDNCMSKAYCKWPVIVAIVVVGCVLISIIFCVARCLCCGAECACCCFRCCASCCPGSGSGRKNKRSESPYGGAPYGGPSSYGASAFPSRAVDAQYRSHAAPVYEPPQYAQFDSPSKPLNEDALPPMPSWGDATSKKVEQEHTEDVELNHLDKDGTAAATVPMLTTPSGATPIRSPGRTVQQEDYGFPGNTGNTGAYSNQNSSLGSGLNRMPSPAHANSYHSYNSSNSFNPEQETGIYQDEHSPSYGQAFSTNAASHPGGYRGVNRSPVSPYRDQYSPTMPYPTSQRRSPQPQQPPYQDFNRNPSLSPGYAPSGSTRYEPSNQSYGAQNMHLPQPQRPRPSPNSGWHTNSGSGQPMNGWRDV